jgi:ABC-2 type transport system ATP-binding protein
MTEDIIIKTTDLVKNYGPVHAVVGLNLSIRKGEVFGLLGPNGAGKTTTTLMLLGLTQPTAGKAEIAGFDCVRNPVEIKKIVGYLPDSVGFYSDMTGRENLRFTGRLNGLGGPELEERINFLLARVGMESAADRKTGTYSRGMKQRLGIADVLIKDPQIIIMDEPTLGIDPEGIRELMTLIRELAEKDGRTILISSHQLYQVQQICDRVGIFVKGHLIACGRIEDLGRQLQSEGNYVLELGVQPVKPELRAELEKFDSVQEVRYENDLYTLQTSKDVHSELTRMLLSQGYDVYHMHQRGGDLDEIYRRYFEKAGDWNGSAVEQADKKPRLFGHSKKQEAV